jgi:glucokinase
MISAPSTFAIGIDIGGSKTKIGLVDTEHGAISDLRVIDTPVRQDTGVLFAETLSAISRALKGRAKSGGHTVDKIGIGICELVEQSGGIVSAHRVKLNREHIDYVFSDYTHIAIESDVRAAAMAEARFGHGKGLSHWIYVNAGTGISSVVMYGSACHRGTHGWAVCLGMNPANIAGEDPTNVEELAGGAALVQLAGKWALPVESVADLFEKYSSGSKVAYEVLEYGGCVLGKAIATLVNTIDPGEIIVGGGLVSKNTPYWEGLVKALKQSVWYSRAKDIPVKTAALQDRGGIVGAALAVQTAHAPVLQQLGPIIDP